MSEELEIEAMAGAVDESIENSEKLEALMAGSDVHAENAELQNECDELAGKLVDVAKELVTVEMEKAELAEKNIRLMAEMQNIKRRSESDVEKAHKFGASKFAKDLLEVGDSIAMGIKATDENTNIKDVRAGLDMTKKVFEKTLKLHGILEVGKVGDEFNPESHEAVSVVPSNEVESGSVAEVLQSGWEINGRLLRPAMVMVAA